MAGNPWRDLPVGLGNWKTAEGSRRPLNAVWWPFHVITSAPAAAASSCHRIG